MWELYQLSYEDDPEGILARFTTQELAEEALSRVNKAEGFEEHGARKVEAYSNIDTFLWQHDISSEASAQSDS